jgi:hypothetical protein
VAAPTAGLVQKDEDGSLTLPFIFTGCIGLATFALAWLTLRRVEAKRAHAAKP